MAVEALAAWLLGAMLATSPPGRSRFPNDARESAEAGRVRYEAIARSIAEVSLDPGEAPLFAGDDGRRRTAAMMLAISHHESGWRRDVDLGLGRHARGGGRYWCLMQIAVDRGRTPEGYRAEDLVRDRRKCFRAALHLLQKARGSCRASGSEAWLRLYTGGSCDRGRKAAEARYATFKELCARHPFREPPAAAAPDPSPPSGIPRRRGAGSGRSAPSN